MKRNKIPKQPKCFTPIPKKNKWFFHEKKFRLFKLSALLIVFCSISSHGQTSPSTSMDSLYVEVSSISGIKKNAISFNLFGMTPIVGITYERLINRKLSIEAGFGLPSFGLGFKIIPFGVKERKALFHVGMSATYVNSDDNEFFGFKGAVFYIPLGLSYIGRKFNFGIDAGPGIVSESSFTTLTPWFNLKLGRRF